MKTVRKQMMVNTINHNNKIIAMQQRWTVVILSVVVTAVLSVVC